MTATHAGSGARRACEEAPAGDGALGAPAARLNGSASKCARHMVAASAVAYR